MKLDSSRSLAAAAIAAALCFQPSLARADMISAQQVAGRNQVDSDRATVQAFVDRADVKQRLQAFGVKNLFAKERVAALSDQEVHQLAQKIDSLPAGGRLSDSDLIIVLLIAILVVVAI